jgi:amino acid permease
MSIAASTRKAYAVDVKASSTEFRKAATDPDVQSALEKITQWIPSEAVATYITLVGLLALADSTGRWILFAVGLLLVVFFVSINAALVNKEGREKWKAEKHQGNPPKLARKRFVALLIVAVVSFTVWAAALPDTPFLSIFDQATRVGAVLVVVVAGAMPKVAKLLEIKVSS